MVLRLIIMSFAAFVPMFFAVADDGAAGHEDGIPVVAMSATKQGIVKVQGDDLFYYTFLDADTTYVSMHV